jgi:hypothetical protein
MGLSGEGAWGRGGPEGALGWIDGAALHEGGVSVAGGGMAGEWGRVGFRCGMEHPCVEMLSVVRRIGV